MRWGNPNWYSMEQWEGIMAGVLKEHEDWEVELAKEIKKEYQRNYYKQNKEKVDRRNRKYYEQNKEKVKKRQRKYREKNLEKVLEMGRDYREKNKEKERERCRKKSRKFREMYPEKEKEAQRKKFEQHYKCKTCNFFRVNKRGQECATCGGYRINSAEYELRDYIKEWYPQAIFDKQMPGSCVQYRPDALIETPWGILIIETDENSHLHEAASCEVVREFNIWQSLGCDVTFIRYNPDSYKPDNFNTQRLTKEERLSALFLTLQEAYETHRPGLHIQYLWYSPARIAELEAARSKLPK